MPRKLDRTDPQVYSSSDTERKLEGQSTPVLLAIAVELDPEYVAEKYEDGWTREDIIKTIKKHLRSAIGNHAIEGWQPIQDVEIESIEED